MLNIFKKTLNGALVLVIALGSTCTMLGIEAFASGEINHSHHEHSIEGGNEMHEHVADAENDHGQDKHVSCCVDSYGDNAMIETGRQNQSLDIIIVPPQYNWAELNLSFSDKLRHQVQAHSPPDNMKRSESEQKSTRLLL